MEQAYLPRDFPAKRALQALARERSSRRGLAQLGMHVAALVGTGWLVVALVGSPWMWPAMWLHGVVLVFLFCPLHETVHRTAFRSRRLNEAVARVCGVLLVLPRDYFRAFHFAHHRHTQDPQRDPELAVPKPATLGAYLWHCSGLPYWRERIVTTLRHAAGRVEEAYVPAHQRRAVVREARAALGLYALLAAASGAAASAWPLWLWLVPVVLGMPALRLYLLAEHTGCPYVPQMFRNTRTTHTTAALRLLAWNMPYHTEHHVFPGAPFHALPRAHTFLAARIEVQAPGYVAVHRELIDGYRRRGRMAEADH